MESTYITVDNYLASRGSDSLAVAPAGYMYIPTGLPSLLLLLLQLLTAAAAATIHCCCQAYTVDNYLASNRPVPHLLVVYVC
jgi:hypothetical protein